MDSIKDLSIYPMLLGICVILILMANMLRLHSRAKRLGSLAWALRSCRRMRKDGACGKQPPANYVLVRMENASTSVLFARLAAMEYRPMTGFIDWQSQEHGAVCLDRTNSPGNKN